MSAGIGVHCCQKFWAVFGNSKGDNLRPVSGHTAMMAVVKNQTAYKD